MLDDAALLNSLDRTLEREGEDAAVALCREAIEARPADAAAHRHLAQLLSARGESLAAQRSAMRACELSPHDPRCWSDLGRVHARAGELDLAIPCFMEAVKIDSLHADGWHNLGLALVKAGCDDDGFTALKKALDIDASRATSWMALGELLLKRGQDADALACFDRAAAAEPDLARTRSRLGEYYLERGRVQRAESLFRRALALDAQHLEGWIGLARSLEDLGESADARQAYLQALRRHPGQGLALGNYIALLHGRDDVDAGEARRWLADAEAALVHDAAPDEAKALVGHGLAKYHDARGDFAAAARTSRLANAARRRANGPLDRAALARRVDGLISTYTPEFFAARRRFGMGNDQPVFIVGLPRSGTTLTEQILSAHPRMHGAGELPDLAQLALRVLDKDEMTWRSAASLTEIDSRETAHLYLRTLQAGTPKGALRISDKSPLNFFHLAFATVLFPGARVIHCKRNARDNALSIWMENFNADQYYATDFDDLACFVRQYDRLMAHWSAVLPLRMLEVRYEDTVADVEAQARRMLDFLGAPWDARCLDFHRNSRAVQTPSRWQVRQSIYGKSVQRWRGYANHLPELLEAFPDQS